MASSRLFILVSWLYLSLLTSGLPFPSPAAGHSIGSTKISLNASTVSGVTSSNSAVRRQGLTTVSSSSSSSSAPLVTKGQTFYRVIPDNEVSLNPIGGSPAKFVKKVGDFSQDGGYYMFADLDVAVSYAMDSGRKKLVSLKWTPPPDIKSKMKYFPPSDAENGSSDFYKLVVNNWTKPRGSSPNIAPVIEGPISKIDYNAETKQISRISYQKLANGKPATQVAIVDATFLRCLKVVAIVDV